jgi:hypothetical protein
MDPGNLISIYPNPSKGTFIVQISGAGNQIGKSEIVVTNILGKTVYKASAKGSYTTVDLSSAEDGVYFVSLQNQWGKTTRKIIVGH